MSDKTQTRDDLAAILLSGDPDEFLRVNGIRGERLRRLAAAVIATCGGADDGMRRMEAAAIGTPARAVFEAVLAGGIQHG